MVMANDRLTASISAMTEKLPELPEMSDSLVADGVRTYLSNIQQKSEIHPLYRRGQWVDLSDQDYIRLSPALLLASRMIACPRATAFFAAFLDGVRTTTTIKHSQKGYSPGLTLERFARPRGNTFGDWIEPVTSAQEDRVRNALHRLSVNTTLRVETPPNPTARAATLSGARIWTHAPGKASKIVLRPDKLREIDLMSASSGDLTFLWLRLAVTFVHETAHAFRFLFEGTSKPEPVFEDDKFDEFGFALVNFLFGGSFYDVSRRHGVLGIPPAGAYQTSKGFIGIMVPLVPAIPLLPGVQPPNRELWVVSPVWLDAIFASNLWTTGQPVVTESLLPEKMFVNGVEHTLRTFFSQFVEVEDAQGAKHLEKVKEYIRV